MAAQPLFDADMLCRHVLVRNGDVVFVKGILEASEGLAALFAERGGDLIISAPLSRRDELDELLADLQSEIGAVVTLPENRELAHVRERDRSARGA